MSPQDAHVDAADPYQWQQQRRRAGREAHFNTPIGGLGDGRYTLWVPAAKTEDKWAFENGVATRKTVVSCLGDTRIQALRDEVFLSLAATAIPGVFDCSAALLTYAAALISANYEVTDADLDFLLAGKSWHDSIARHLLGGDDVIERLLKLGTIPARQAPISPPQPTPTPPPPAKERFSAVRRLFDKLRR